jgi:hypothetical protein
MSFAAHWSLTLGVGFLLLISGFTLRAVVHRGRQHSGQAKTKGAR